MENVKAIVAGAAGRMGKKTIKAIVETDGIELVGALESSNHELMGKDAGIVAGVEELGIRIDTLDTPNPEALKTLQATDVIINFTTPEAVEAITSICIAQKKPMVIGTTAIPVDALCREIYDLSKIVPVVLAPNFSIGANTIFVILPKILQLIGATFTDFTISEIHHTGKKDAPSGTAKKMAQIIAKEKEWNIDHDIYYSLEGKKVSDKVYVVAIRSGNTKGEHRVLIASKTEEIEIIHRVADRQTFAEGAVRAAIFATHAVKGFYDMTDVLEFNPRHSMGCVHH
ncbi:4-hydroxy-tetrahydrodipicolinate reductase [Patescibacteria group bacterium]